MKVCIRRLSPRCASAALGKGSPCVDKGLDLDWIFKGVTRDIRNQRRYKRFRGDHPDIGAWEYAPPIGFAMVIK